MKRQTIEKMVLAGVSQDKAEKAWATVREKLCDGDEPTAAGLGLLTDEDFTGALPALAARSFIAATWLTPFIY